MHSTALRKSIPAASRGVNADFAAAVLRRLAEVLAQLGRKG
jgi:hypothetical protein